MKDCLFFPPYLFLVRLFFYKNINEISYYIIYKTTLEVLANKRTYLVTSEVTSEAELKSLENYRKMTINVTLINNNKIYKTIFTFSSIIVLLLL